MFLRYLAPSVPVLLLAFAAAVAAPGSLNGVPAPVGDDIPQVNGAPWCDIFISRESSKDVLVFDSTGKLMEDAKQVYVWFHVAVQKPTARVYRYAGLYRPKNVASEIWSVRSIEFVDQARFQQLVDDGHVAVKPAAAAETQRPAGAANR